VDDNVSITVVLGCFGRNVGKFVFCKGVENQILNIDDHIEHYNEMMDYFDACRLFDKPMFEYSAILHFIRNMQDRFDQVAINRRLWTEMEYQTYQKFVAEHRNCGLYIKLAPAPKDLEEESPEEVSVRFKASKGVKPQVNLRLIRGRR